MHKLSLCPFARVALNPFTKLSLNSLPFAGICGLPGAAGPDRNLHAWQNPHSKDLPHPDLPCPLVAEDP